MSNYFYKKHIGVVIKIQNKIYCITKENFGTRISNDKKSARNVISKVTPSVFVVVKFAL
jgi:hypothetical protein